MAIELSLTRRLKPTPQILSRRPRWNGGVSSTCSWSSAISRPASNGPLPDDRPPRGLSPIVGHQPAPVADNEAGEEVSDLDMEPEAAILDRLIGV